MIKLKPVIQNLLALDEEASSIVERRMAHLYEAARILLGQRTSDRFFLRDEDFCASCRAFLDGKRSDDASPLLGTVGEEAFSGAYRGVLQDVNAVLEQVSFSRLLLDAWKSPITPGEICGALPVGSGMGIAYVRNYYADAAFRRFSLVLEQPTVHDCEDFTTACEEVVGGNAAFCILPLESSGEGRLLSFRRLMEQYELKTVMTVSVPSIEGNKKTLFALLAGHFTVLQPMPRGRLQYQISVPSSDETALTAVLGAARLCGLHLISADALPLSYAEREYSTDLLFDAGTGDLTTFLTWISLFLPVGNPVGLFIDLQLNL